MITNTNTPIQSCHCISDLQYQELVVPQERRTATTEIAMMALVALVFLVVDHRGLYMSSCYIISFQDSSQLDFNSYHPLYGHIFTVMMVLSKGLLYMRCNLKPYCSIHKYSYDCEWVMLL